MNCKRLHSRNRCGSDDLRGAPLRATFLGVMFLLTTVIFSACESVPSGGFRFEDETTVFSDAQGIVLDDIIVWPVSNMDNAHLTEDGLDRFTRALRRGLIKSRYSVLSRAVVDSVAKSGARGDREGAEESAVAAAKKLEADGVLVLWLTSWDEYALDTLGKINARGEFLLKTPSGKICWKGRFTCSDRVSEEPGSLPPTREARRGHAIDRVVELFVGRLPKHQN